jgi:hypothetical protein
LDGRLELEDGGRRLTLRRSKVADSGLFACRAVTAVDTDSMSARVIIKDRPGAPTHVRLTSCASDSAEITWSPAADNNEPIVEYVVYVSTSHDDVASGSSHPRVVGKRVSGQSLSARVGSLAPWTTYTFRVAAVNAIGEGAPAAVVAGGSGGSDCRTPSARPLRGPRRVCTDSRGPRQLVIVWEPMLPIEHHGDGFHYVVEYRRLNDAGPARRVVVTDWRQSELVVDAVETFVEYEVAVQAANSLGPAPNHTIERRVGYSGQDIPLEVPANFHHDSDSINSTSALFMWDPVNTSVPRIRGFFRGYQIQFWKTDKPSVVRTVDVILHQWKPCRYPNHVPAAAAEAASKQLHGRDRRSSSAPVTGRVTTLWPYTSITATVRVLNGAKAGPLSTTTTFRTLEGVPDAVPMFWVSERGSHHLKLSWTAPFETNGVLTGYIISYREASASHSEGDQMLRKTVIDPQQTYKKLFDLRDDSVYIITIWALTAAGRGVEKVISEVTVPSSEPDRPAIANLDTGYDFLNVSWRPSGDEPSNPASAFLVEYQLEGSEDWQKTDIEREHNWINVSGLIHGSSYRIRVAAIDRHGDTMKSEAMWIAVGIQPAAVHDSSVTSASLQIVAICVGLLVLFVVTVLAAVALHRRRHSGRYPVHEKERLHGANGGNLYDEAPFGEYVRTDDSLKKKSMGSLESSSKSEEDGTDSLGIYEDVDPIKFTDDGSFAEHVGASGVGGGGGYKKMREDDEPVDVTTTSALSELV